MGLHDDDARSQDLPADSGDFLDALHGVLSALRRDAMEARGGEGDALSPGQLRMLRTLDRCGGPRRPGELAAMLRVAPRSVTSKVDQAEEDGLVERLPDPGDRRATLVALTDRGHQALRLAAAQRHEGATRRLSRLTPEERATLLHLLRTVAED